MMIGHEIDEAVRAMAAHLDDPGDIEAGHARAMRSLDAAITGRPPASGRFIPHTRRAVVFAFAFVLLGGVAVAATTDLADQILNSREPTSDRIDAVRRDQRPTMTQAQLIDQFRAASVEQQVGEGLGARLGNPLVQDDRARISARRTTDGNVCVALDGYASLKPSEPARWRPASAFCGSLIDGWPLMDAVGSNTFAGSLSYGLFVDGVKQVRFIVEDETLDAIMGDGAFLWRNPQAVWPRAIEAVLMDGTVVRRDLERTRHEHDPGRPSKPYVVG